MDELMEMLYDHEEQTFLDSPTKDSAAPRLPASLQFHAGPESLSTEQQEARLDLWRSGRSDRVATGKTRLLGAALPATLLSVVCDRYVSQPRLTMVFQGCEAADWREVDGLTFGMVVKSIVPTQGFATALTDEFEELPLISREREVHWRNVGEDVEIELSPDSFRPQKAWSIDHDELVVVARDPRAQGVQVTWSLTEEGSDDVTEGKIFVTTADAIDALELVQRTITRP
ncbi:hypothetical protein [Brachybacterium fresconis]|uniref:Uncharacterized protein n=1 Tax=Brachybacterium fresconis TaxID=173363 RepID=A0ABS4YQC6_9MICO|nr:hypothetical protein [Brachybacterium fresconis]MBP2410959.1 hypothetical protein [Brachybacterium fresconis]